MRLIFVLLALMLLGSSASAEEKPLTLFAVNVGKADAILLQSGQTTYLIDTGTEESWGKLSCALTNLGVTHLTGVIITHTDKDHGGGALTLATSSIQVEHWYAPAYYTDVKEKKHPAVMAAALRNQAVQWLQAGDTIPLDGGTLTVLGPLSASETENCNSLVLLAEGGGGRMLLTGDMEFPEEEELLKAGMIPPCQVLKVGNHGESDATSEALVRVVQPEIAVISTNSTEEPDTPANRVVKLLMGAGAQIAQTQHAQAGVLVTLENGKASAQLMGYGEFPAQMTGIVLTGRDAKADHIRIRNDSVQAVDLSGCYLRSDRGGQQLVLPAGTMLAPGAELLVSTQSSEVPGDIVWPDEKVWHKSKDDAAYLYDAYGREIAYLP
ncbi:MAG: MBL fold metallo-hydrolase [Clostridia bacterium]|nr:MBL fold metallo-hydrolase [Clostridia bacterium]